GSQIRIAGFIAVLGDTATAVKLGAVIPYLLVCGLIAAVLLRLGSSPGEAGLAAAGFIGFGRLADLSVDGISNSTDALLFTLAIVAMGGPRGGSRAVRGGAVGLALPLLAGSLAGLLALHRYSFILFVPVPVMYLAWHHRRVRGAERWRAAGAAAGGTALTL